jgi:hypothetical protein
LGRGKLDSSLKKLKSVPNSGKLGLLSNTAQTSSLLPGIRKFRSEDGLPVSITTIPNPINTKKTLNANLPPIFFGILASSNHLIISLPFIYGKLAS